MIESGSVSVQYKEFTNALAHDSFYLGQHQKKFSSITKFKLP